MCKCEVVKKYDGVHRCMLCFSEFEQIGTSKAIPLVEVMASQKLYHEMSLEDRDNADYMDGFDVMVDNARSVLRILKGDTV